MLRARLQRLVERLRPPERAITIEGWCDPDGRPCDPPAEAQRAVEEQAAGHSAGRRGRRTTVASSC